MATEEVILQGKGKWVKLYAPNQFNKYSLLLYMDQQNVDKFKALKVMNHLKKDEDGYYVQLSRNTTRKVRGNDVPLAPPTVLDKDNLPTTVAIGNGSDLSVKLEHYSYPDKFGPSGQMKYACRIAGVRIDNLVPFSDESRTDEEIKDIKIFKDKPIPF